MPAARKPEYLLHKPSGRARVRINGRDHYLGPHGSPESRHRYDELIAEWFANQGDPTRLTLTVDDLALLYLEFAKSYYRKNGKTTREFGNIRSALRQLLRQYGTTKVLAFGPRKLREFRDRLVNKPDERIKPGSGRVVSRSYVNKAMSKIVRMFKWGVAEEIVPVTVYQALTTVEGLKRGRTDARETAPVLPVEDSQVDTVLPLVAPQVTAMIGLQRLTGMRPGDAILLRPCDITMRSDGVWSYRPQSHKTEHHGRERVVVIGPKAQEVLRPWMDRASESYCFSPHEAVEHLNAKKRARRKTPVQPSQRDRRKSTARRRPGAHYSENAYRRAIQRACRSAGIPTWSPNQLRHNFGTLVRSEFGLEAAQVALGHARADVTQIYSERDFSLAIRVAKDVG